MKAGLSPLRGPADMPRLRDYLLHSWRIGGPLAAATEINRQRMRSEGHPAALGDDPLTTPEDYWHRQVLQDGALWYVEPEMCDLIAAAEKALPPDTILDDRLVPMPRGLVVFAKPFVGIDAETGDRTMSVDALSWGPVHIVDRRAGAYALGIASYQRMNLDDGLGMREMDFALTSGAMSEVIDATRAIARPGDAFLAHGEIWAPLGRSDWVNGSRIDAPHEGQGGMALLESAMEDRSRLATLFLLTQQVGVAETRTLHMSRGERRREERAGREPKPVLIVMLPRRVHVAREASEPTGRHQRVRSYVNGFWRNQVYGPGRAYRRPTWVHGFWRGPEDGPVHVPQKVHVVRPLTDEELERGDA